MPDNHLRIAQKPVAANDGVHRQVFAISAEEATDISEDHPFQAGPTDGVNIRIGADVIQALLDGVPVTLRINPLGSPVEVGGDVTVLGDISAQGGEFTSSVNFLEGALGLPNRGSKQFVDGGDSNTFSSTDWISSNGNIQECGLTFRAPPSGSVWVVWTVKGKTSIGDDQIQISFEAFEQNVNGTVIYSPNTFESITIGTTNRVTGMWLAELNNLTPDIQYYIRLSFKVSDSATGTLYGRSIAYMPRM